VVFIFVTQAYYAGFGNLDFTLERHFRVRESVRFVRRNRGLAIGNGTVYLLLLLSVVGFLVALPLATVAGCAALRPLLEREGR
jgi:CysZ protein